MRKKNSLYRKLRKGNGMTILGLYMIMICMMFFMASMSLFMMKYRARTTKIAADSLADGVATQMTINRGDFATANDYAEEMRTLVNETTGADIDSVTLDEDAFNESLISVSAESSGTYTAMDRIVNFQTQGYTRRAQSTTEFGRNGAWLWPCPVYSRISCPFGYRYHPITGVYHMHGGIDIAASMGASVIATSGGVVITADAVGASANGKYIKIDHGDGYISYYLHLSSLNVTVGQTVTGGQVIGAVGSTGSSTGPHLDFRIYLNGAPQDPLNYVSEPEGH